MTENAYDIMKLGAQIIYIPNHADGNENHPDVETGFITSVRGDGAFCRYWSKHRPGELRTKANSELTPLANLRLKRTVSDEQVAKAIHQICKDAGNDDR